MAVEPEYIRQQQRRRQLREFQRHAKHLLSSGERRSLQDILHDYHVNHQVKTLVQRLCSLLDTPSKLDLLADVRSLLPTPHQAQYDSLAPYHTMANPITKHISNSPISNPTLSVVVPPSEGNFYSVVAPPSGINVQSMEQPGRFNIQGVMLPTSGIGTHSVVMPPGSPGHTMLVAPPRRDSPNHSRQHTPSHSRHHSPEHTHHNSPTRSRHHSPNRHQHQSISKPGASISLPRPKQRHLQSAVKGSSTVPRPRKHQKAITRGPVDPAGRVNPVHIIVLVKEPREGLGFSIRGGSEHGLGIYVSELEPDSPAEHAGVRLGDNIVEVNSISFENIASSSAVKVLTGSRRLKMVVRRVGKIPGFKFAREKTSWYDVSQNRIVEGSFEDHGTFHVPPGLIYISDIIERRIHMHITREDQYLGFNIRGGSEYGLGIYVSRVDPGGLAEQTGLRVGDQVLDVNGVNFENVTHANAVDMMRSHPQLIMKTRDVGKYPAYKEIYAEYSWIDGATGTISKSRSGYITSIPVRSESPDNLNLAGSERSVSQESHILPPGGNDTRRQHRIDPSDELPDCLPGELTDEDSPRSSRGWEQSSQGRGWEQGSSQSRGWKHEESLQTGWDDENSPRHRMWEEFPGNDSSPPSLLPKSADVTMRERPLVEGGGDTIEQKKAVKKDSRSPKSSLGVKAMQREQRLYLDAQTNKTQSLPNGYSEVTHGDSGSEKGSALRITQSDGDLLESSKAGKDSWDSHSSSQRNKLEHSHRGNAHKSEGDLVNSQHTADDPPPVPAPRDKEDKKTKSKPLKRVQSLRKPGEIDPRQLSEDALADTAGRKGKKARKFKEFLFGTKSRGHKLKPDSAGPSLTKQKSRKPLSGLGFGKKTKEEPASVDGHNQSVPDLAGDGESSASTVGDDLEYPGGNVMMGKIHTKARSLLNRDETSEVMKHVQQYDSDKDVDQLVHSLLAILDTKEKAALLQDIREVVSPGDHSKYDRLVSRLDPPTPWDEDKEIKTPTMRESTQDQSGTVKPSQMSTEMNVTQKSSDIPSVQIHTQTDPTTAPQLSSPGLSTGPPSIQMNLTTCSPQLSRSSSRVDTSSFLLHSRTGSNVDPMTYSRLGLPGGEENQIVVPASPNDAHSYEIHRPRSNSKLYPAQKAGEGGGGMVKTWELSSNQSSPVHEHYNQSHKPSHHARHPSRSNSQRSHSQFTDQESPPQPRKSPFRSDSQRSNMSRSQKSPSRSSSQRSHTSNVDFRSHPTKTPLRSHISSSSSHSRFHQSDPLQHASQSSYPDKLDQIHGYTLPTQATYPDVQPSPPRSRSADDILEMKERPTVQPGGREQYSGRNSPHSDVSSAYSGISGRYSIHNQGDTDPLYASLDSVGEEIEDEGVRLVGSRHLPVSPRTSQNIAADSASSRQSTPTRSFANALVFLDMDVSGSHDEGSDAVLSDSGTYRLLDSMEDGSDISQYAKLRSNTAPRVKQRGHRYHGRPAEFIPPPPPVTPPPRQEEEEWVTEDVSPELHRYITPQTASTPYSFPYLATPHDSSTPYVSAQEEASPYVSAREEMSPQSSPPPHDLVRMAPYVSSEHSSPAQHSLKTRSSSPSTQRDTGSSPSRSPKHSHIESVALRGRSPSQVSQRESVSMRKRSPSPRAHVENISVRGRSPSPRPRKSISQDMTSLRASLKEHSSFIAVSNQQTLKEKPTTDHTNKEEGGSLPNGCSSVRSSRSVESFPGSEQCSSSTTPRQSPYGTLRSESRRSSGSQRESVTGGQEVAPLSVPPSLYNSAVKDANISSFMEDSVDVGSLSNVMAPLSTQTGKSITVVLQKSRPSLGISISGGSNSRKQPHIHVENVFPKGAASDEGTIKPGMRLLSVGPKSLDGATHAQAVEIIRKEYADKMSPQLRLVVVPQ